MRVWDVEMDPKEIRKLVTIDDKKEWSGIYPQAGFIIEADLAQSDMSWASETWAAFYIYSVGSELDGGFTLEVKVLGVEDADAGQALETHCGGTVRFIHL